MVFGVSSQWADDLGPPPTTSYHRFTLQLPLNGLIHFLENKQALGSWSLLKSCNNQLARVAAVESASTFTHLGLDIIRRLSSINYSNIQLATVDYDDRN